MKKEMTQDQKNLIKKYESPKTKSSKTFDSKKKEMYLQQTDRNYKDGDRN